MWILASPNPGSLTGSGSTAIGTQVGGTPETPAPVTVNHLQILWFTLWLFNIAMENGPFIDGLPIKNGDFPWLC